MFVEPNAYFEPLFYENQIKYPDVNKDNSIGTHLEMRNEKS